jgi:hypothetical protein
MKFLHRYVVVASLLMLSPWLARGATAANELYLTQRNAGNTANTQRTVAPVATSVLAFDASHVPVELTIQQLLDRISTTQGTILYRNGTTWVGLAPGTSGYFLQAQGTGANPQWAAASGAGLGDVSGPASATDGSLVLFDGTSGKNVKQGALSGLTLTAGTLSVDAATLTAAGKVELATTAEITTGTDSTRAVTPGQLASATVPVGDVLLGGTSGPSVKSSLAARAPRQWLVLDGSSRGTATLGSALNAHPFTVEVVAMLPTANPAAAVGLLTIGTYGGANSCNVLVNTNGDVYFDIFDDAAAVVRHRISGVSERGGKAVDIVFTRSASAIAAYIDGKPATITTSGTGNPLHSVSGTAVSIGGLGAASYYTGYIGPVRIWNRQLSAAEVAELFEASRPKAADHNNASNVSLIAGDASTFASDTGWEKQTNVTISGGKLNFAATPENEGARVINILTVGKRYRLSFTIDSLTGSIYGAASDTVWTTPGAKSVEFTAAQTYVKFSAYDGAATAVFDDVTVIPIGLLLSPDPMEPGIGYQWHDTSRTVGPYPDITLPASGVSWALPGGRSNFVRNTLTWAGTNEAKSLLGQRCFPDGAVMRFGTRKASAGSSGTGLSLGTSNVAPYWQNADTYTTAKEVISFANVLPAGTANNDHDVLVTPDNAAFTGSQSVEIHYTVTAGTP